MKVKLIRSEGIPAANGLVEGEVYEVETNDRYPGVYAVLSGLGMGVCGIFYMQDRFETIEEQQ